MSSSGRRHSLPAHCHQYAFVPNDGAMVLSRTVRPGMLLRVGRYTPPCLDLHGSSVHGVCKVRIQLYIGAFEIRLGSCFQTFFETRRLLQL